MKRHYILPSPLGALVLFADDEGLTAIDFPGGGPPLVPAGDTPILREAAEQLTAWFGGERTRFDLPLRAAGTPFQRQVWEALCAIPYGQTCSYGDIAKQIGSPAAVRAVGTANGRNPLPIVVPCHRVIGANGTLTGYAGGLSIKRWLLAHEASHDGQRAAS